MVDPHLKLKLEYNEINNSNHVNFSNTVRSMHLISSACMVWRTHTILTMSADSRTHLELSLSSCMT